MRSAPSWASPTEFVYVSDGRIRRRTIGTPAAQTVAFSATLQVTQPQYPRRVRDFTSTAPRKALGIVRPVISPDGSQIAFAAVGDIYVVPSSGGRPVNLTNDSALDTDPVVVARRRQSRVFVGQGQPAAAAVDPRHEERAGPPGHLLTTQPQGASFSPDGKKVVFFNVDGMWRVAEMSVLDVATGP